MSHKSPLTLTPPQAAVLFDFNGSVIWTVKDRATVTGLSISRIDPNTVRALVAQFGGSTTLRFGSGQSIWTVYGRESDVFSEAILSHTQQKHAILSAYINFRKIIDLRGRGASGILSDDDLAYRKQIATFFKQQQEDV